MGFNRYWGGRDDGADRTVYLTGTGSGDGKTGRGSCDISTTSGDKVVVFIIHVTVTDTGVPAEAAPGIDREGHTVGKDSSFGQEGGVTGEEDSEGRRVGHGVGGGKGHVLGSTRNTSGTAGSTSVFLGVWGVPCP